MARESSLWTWLAKSRDHFGNRLHINRVENAIMAGMPDVEGFLNSAEEATYSSDRVIFKGQFWLELKSEERPKRPTTPIRFDMTNREKQIEWMRCRRQLGGNAYWLLQVGSYSERQIYLLPGGLGHLLTGGILEAELALLCTCSGVFNARSKPEDILKRVVSWRNNQ